MGRHLVRTTAATGVAAEEVAIIARAVFERLRARGAPVTLSYGVATFGADGRTLDDLTKAADEALYTAKRHGPIGIRATVAAG